MLDSLALKVSINSTFISVLFFCPIEMSKLALVEFKHKFIKMFKYTSIILWVDFFAYEGRDEKGCLLSTEKKAAVDVDHRPDSSFLLVKVSKLFLVDSDQTALFQPVYVPRSSMSVDMSTSVDVHFTTLFITPQWGDSRQ